jgi:hypothetical protein
MRTAIQKNLILAAMVAVVALMMSGCCSSKHCCKCGRCMDKNTCVKMMNDGSTMPTK